MSEHEKSPEPQYPPPTYETLKAQLEIAQNERAALERELREARENMREEILGELLNEIDSEDWRYPLGELYKNVSRFRQVPRDELMKLPAPFPSIVANERNLLRAFERIGFKAFGNIGETFELTPDKFDSFELQGLPIPQGETKTVEIVSPGWKYNDKIISLPKVSVIDS